MSDLDLSIGFNLNNEQVDAELDQTRERIRGVGGEATRQEGILQRLERQARIYARGMREATMTENIDKYNRKLQETQAEIRRLSTLAEQAGRNGRNSFNGLQNSINQISRELPAFTFSAQTGFLAISNNLPILADELARVRAANAALVASGQTATPVWKQLVSSLFSWGTALSLGVTLLTIYGKEIGNFITSLFKGAAAIDAAKERLKILNSAFESTDYKKAITNVTELTINIDLAKKGLLNKEQVLNQYNETIGKTTGRVGSLMQAEKELANNAPDYIKMTLYKAAAQLALEEAAKKSLEAEQQRLKKAEEFRTGFDKYTDATMSVGAGPGARVDLVQERKNAEKRNEQRKKVAIEETEKLAKVQEDIAKTFQLKAAKIASDPKNKFNFFGDNKATKTKDASTGILDSRKEVYDKLKALDDEFRIKSFASDKEELEALANKFNKMRDIIVKENEKIAQYNKKNPKKVIGLIDVAEVDPIEKRATADLVFKQSTEKLTEELSKQKELFSQYEDFKTKTSLAEADKRFKADLKGFKDYGARLQAEIDKINQTPANEQTGGQLDLLAKLKADKDAYDRDKKNKELQQYADDLKDFQTYAEKRVALQKKYSELAEKFRTNGEDGKAQQAIDTGLEEVSKLDEANVQKMASYKKVFDYVGKRTKQNTLDAIEEFQKELNAASITAEARIKIQKEVDKLKNSVERGSVKDIEQLATALGQVASEFADINGNIGNIASVLVNSAKAYVSVKNDLKTMNDPKADTTAKIGAGLGIVGAGLSVVNAIGGYFRGLREAKEKAWKAMADFQSAAIKGELDYQALLRKRESDDIKRGKNSYRAIVDQLELLKKQSPEVQKAYDRIFASLQGQSFVESIGYKHGTWIRKAKTWDIMASLAGSEYADLEKLYMQGKLKDQAKADFESLRALKDELKEAGIAVEDLQAQLNELLTGTSVSGLADGLQQLFENGKYAAQDFGDSFTEIMRKAINSSFKEKLLKDAMQPFYDEFAALFVNGTPSEDQINALKSKYIALGQEFGDKFKELEKITGQSLTSGEADKASPSTIKGAVENITAKQADVLSANIAGQRLAQLEGNQDNRQGFATLAKSGAEQLAVIREQHYVQMEIAANTLRTANNTDNLKEGLTDIKDEIQALNKKVGSSGDAKKAMGG